MSEYASISELRERLSKLPKINSEAFIQACRERGPITPFDLENAVKNKIKEATVYYIYVGAGGRFRFKPYTLKREVTYEWRYIEPPNQNMVFSVDFDDGQYTVKQAASMIDPQSADSRAGR